MLVHLRFYFMNSKCHCGICSNVLQICIQMYTSINNLSFLEMFGINLLKCKKKSIK